MKKNILLLVLITMISFMLMSCGNKIDLQLTDSSVKYELRDNDELGCTELIIDDKIYRPYEPADISMAGEVVGYYNDADEDNADYVLSAVGQSTDEWLVTVLNNGSDKVVNGNNIGFLYKEVGVTNIPEGYEAEESYTWN
jgi:hypothetical protein